MGDSRHHFAGRNGATIGYPCFAMESPCAFGTTLRCVVSPRLQHWDAQNLFVVGASVYPHNSGFNPTGPLAALALRLGDDLVQYQQRPRML